MGSGPQNRPCSLALKRARNADTRHVRRSKPDKRGSLFFTVCICRPSQKYHVGFVFAALSGRFSWFAFAFLSSPMFGSFWVLLVLLFCGLFLVPLFCGSEFVTASLVWLFLGLMLIPRLFLGLLWVWFWVLAVPPLSASVWCFFRLLL